MKPCRSAGAAIQSVHHSVNRSTGSNFGPSSSYSDLHVSSSNDLLASSLIGHQSSFKRSNSSKAYSQESLGYFSSWSLFESSSSTSDEQESLSRTTSSASSRGCFNPGNLGWLLDLFPAIFFYHFVIPLLNPMFLIH